MLLYEKMEDVYNKNLDISLKYMIESYSLFIILYNHIILQFRFFVNKK